MADPADLVWAENILPPIIQLAIFGGSITFTVVPAQNSEPKRFKDSFETLLALGWLFFVITLGWATAAQMALSFQRNNIRDAINQGYRTWLRAAGRIANEQLACWVFVQLRIVDVLCITVQLAFLFLSLCVAAYSVVVGWLAFGCTVGMIAFFVVTWIVQRFA